MDIERHINKGFTLIELILTIVLTGIIIGVANIYIVVPVQNFADVVSRAELIDSAELSLRRMERDINAALPNSIRVKSDGNLRSLEIVNVVEGKRYRKKLPGVNDDILDFGSADSAFNVLGPFQDAALGANGYRIVIYNTGAQVTSSDTPTPGANIYASSSAPGPALPLGSHVVTPADTVVSLANNGDEGRITLDVAHQFSLQSPTQRLYVIDTPVSYVCNLDNGTITRYENYNINEVQPIDESSIPLTSASSALVTNKVSACEFTYQPGTSQRNSVVTLDLTVANNDEEVRLLQQVGITNAP